MQKNTRVGSSSPLLEELEETATRAGIPLQGLGVFIIPTLLDFLYYRFNVFVAIIRIIFPF